VGAGGGEECAGGGNASYLPREMDATRGPSDISLQLARRIELERGSSNARALRMQHRCTAGLASPAATGQPVSKCFFFEDASLAFVVEQILCGMAEVAAKWFGRIAVPGGV
jgi:hypothetical protein